MDVHVNLAQLHNKHSAWRNMYSEMGRGCRAQSHPIREYLEMQGVVVYMRKASANVNVTPLDKELIQLKVPYCVNVTSSMFSIINMCLEPVSEKSPCLTSFVCSTF